MGEAKQPTVLLGQIIQLRGLLSANSYWFFADNVDAFCKKYFCCFKMDVGQCCNQYDFNSILSQCLLFGHFVEAFINSISIKEFSSRSGV